jgi:hypothetical protein
MAAALTPSRIGHAMEVRGVAAHLARDGLEAQELDALQQTGHPCSTAWEVAEEVLFRALWEVVVVCDLLNEINCFALEVRAQDEKSERTSRWRVMAYPA